MSRARAAFRPLLLLGLDVLYGGRSSTCVLRLCTPYEEGPFVGVNERSMHVA